MARITCARPSFARPQPKENHEIRETHENELTSPPPSSGTDAKSVGRADDADTQINEEPGEEPTARICVIHGQILLIAVKRGSAAPARAV